MPGLDGLELCRRVRQRDEPRYTSVVLLTSHDAAASAVEGMQAGADDYLVKPLRPAELRLRLIAAQRLNELHERLAEQRRQLAELGAEQHGLARRDPLTGLGNRRALLEELERLDARFRRYGHGYALALVDVDHFKQFNDTHGHPAGDAALRAVAAVLGRAGGPDDVVARYGGEEFVLLFPGATTAQAVERLEAARRAIAALEVPLPGGPPGRVTASAGVASWPLDPPVGREDELVAEADRRLFMAKHLGRDRVVGTPAEGGARPLSIAR